MRAYLKRYHAENKERLKAQRLTWRDRERAACREYAKRNRAKLNAIHAKRKAMQKLAVPSWADHKAMNSFYEQARALTVRTGVEHEVDHIVPIKSRIICGLHCQQNLRVIPASENNSKNNRFWPDMP